ncbi:MAG: hypothetical protein OEZ31_07215 [Nitrospirota bacterium]|nr:hypothetical protein [Nitrospirota bacterium]MDH5768728.1 hypothetical protein [Nitrospirota bacterium]
MGNKINIKDMVIGIGFYRREQWPLLLETSVDAQILGKTYDEWLDVLDSSIEKIRSHGIEPELIEVDVNKLLAFCEKHGMKNNAEARSRFISELAREQKISKQNE